MVIFFLQNMRSINATNTNANIDMTAPLRINDELSTQYTLGNYPFPNKFGITIYVKLDENTTTNHMGFLTILNDIVGNVCGQYCEHHRTFSFEYSELVSLLGEILNPIGAFADTLEEDYENGNEECEFSLEYALYKIPTKLNSFKNNPKIESFTICYDTPCCNNHIELYIYNRNDSVEE